jgi:antitoxin VapB
MATTNSTAKPLAAPATKTAKLFKNGRSQAVRLPKEFRFEGTEVAIRRDAATGEVLLSEPATRPARSLQELLDLFDSHRLSEEEFQREIHKLGKLSARELFQIFDWAEFPEDFMADRKVHMPRELDLF